VVRNAPAGFLGFPPFALECYVFVNLLNAVRRGEGGSRSNGRTRCPALAGGPGRRGGLVFNAAVFAGIQAMTVAERRSDAGRRRGNLRGHAGTLTRAGVTTPPVLLRRTAARERLTTLAHVAGLSSDVLRELREAARLIDLDGLGADHYNACGVSASPGSRDLARQDPPPVPSMASGGHSPAADPRAGRAVGPGRAPCFGERTGPMMR